jgi:hypothetical protein
MLKRSRASTVATDVEQMICGSALLHNGVARLFVEDSVREEHFFSFPDALRENRRRAHSLPGWRRGNECMPRRHKAGMRRPKKNLRSNLGPTWVQNRPNAR